MMLRTPNTNNPEEVRRAFQALHYNANGVTPTTVANWNLAYTHKTTEDAINGLVKCSGAGSYSAIADNSTAWNSAASASHVAITLSSLTGITLTGQQLSFTSGYAIPTTGDISNGNTAYGWGNHASIGYLTSQTSHADVVQDGDFTSQGIMLRGSSAGVYSILTDNSSAWNTALQPAGDGSQLSGVVHPGQDPDYTDAYKETAGKVWTDLGQQASQAGIYSIVSLGSGIALAGTGTGGLVLRTVDYGMNWTNLGQIPNMEYMLCFAYLGNGIVVAGGEASGQISRSTDYGLTWASEGYPGSQYSILSLEYFGNGIVVGGTGSGGKILRSTDYGDNWTDLGQQSSQNYIYSFAYLGNGIAVAGTGSSGLILRSTDYGATWTSLGQQASADYILCLLNLGNGIALAGTGVNGKILRSTDYGATWTSLGQQFSETRVASLAHLGNGVVVAGTGTTGKILRSNDYGATWSDLGQQVSQTYIYSLAYLGNGVAVAGTSTGGKILRSAVLGVGPAELYTPLSHKTTEDALNGLVKCNGSGTYSAVADNSGNWNTAYGWGNHASAGYLTSQTSHADVVQDGDFTSQGIMLRGASAGTYSILTDGSANWNTAYGWGNHASAGYLTPTGTGTNLNWPSVTAGQLAFWVNGPGETKLFSGSPFVLYDSGGAALSVPSITSGIYPTNQDLTITASSGKNIILSGMKFPNADGTANYVLKTDGAGVLSWTAQSGAGLSGMTATRVQYALNATTLTDNAGLVFDGTYLTVNSIKDTALTATRVTYSGASGLLADSANLTFNGTYLSATGIKDTGLTSDRVVYSIEGGQLADSANLTFNGTALSISGFTAQRSINVATSLYIATTGSDSTGDGTVGTPWLTIGKALTYLADYILNAAVTIYLADGTYTVASAIAPTHLNGIKINITGTNTHTKTISSVQSSSGGSGAWAIILNLNNVTNIAVNDYILISRTAGGTNPNYLQGCHKITNVDAPNNRITITSKHINAAAPSGNVASSYGIVVKSMLSCTGGGFNLTQYSLGTVSNLILAGPDIVNAYYGIQINTASCLIGNNIGITNFYGGARVDAGGVLTTANYTCFSGCALGCWASSGVIQCYYSIVSGNTYGHYSDSNGSISEWQGVVTGNTIGDLGTMCGIIAAPSVTYSGNGTNTSPTANTLGTTGGFVTG